MKALILSGGGAKGSFQIGILSYLLDVEQIDYDIYGGTSVGSLNAAILATGPLLETLPVAEKIWLEEIKSNHSVWTHHLWNYILAGIALIVFFIFCAFASFIFDGSKLLTLSFIFCALFSLYVPYYSLRKTKSLYKTDPLKHILKKYMDVNKLKISGKKLLVGAISYKTGKYHYGTEKDDNIIDWVLASSAFPVFFPMVEIDGENYVDGGVLSIDLLYEIQKLGAKEIDIILTSPMNLSLFEKFGLSNQFERTLDLLSVENLSNDIALCKLNNNVRIFMPKKNFNVSSLNFDPNKIKEIYESGKKFEVNEL